MEFLFTEMGKTVGRQIWEGYQELSFWHVKFKYHATFKSHRDHWMYWVEIGGKMMNEIIYLAVILLQIAFKTTDWCGNQGSQRQRQKKRYKKHTTVKSGRDKKKPAKDIKKGSQWGRRKTRKVHLGVKWRDYKRRKSVWCVLLHKKN